jgi:hypothetical protein
VQREFGALEQHLVLNAHVLLKFVAGARHASIEPLPGAAGALGQAEGDVTFVNMR